MKNLPVKKMISAALAAVMAASALTAMSSCGKKEPVLEKRTNVYTGSEIVLPEGVDYVQNLFSANNNICMMYTKVYTVTYNEQGTEMERVPGYSWSEEQLADGWYQDYQSSNYIATLSVDTQEFKEIPVELEDNNSYIQSIACDSEGTVWALITKWEYNEEYTE